MTFRLYDTATGEVRPLDAGPVVKMYTCGITPYDATHLGHATTFLAFDLLQRRLIDLGHEVRCVRNVTDVDDSLLARANEMGAHYLDLAAASLARFDADLDALGLLPPWSEPHASGAITDIRKLVGALLDAGVAYRSEGSVFLDVAAAGGLGTLSGLDEDAMMAVAVERGERLDLPGRRAPLDTVLWQAAAPGEPEWEARWGPGRPGWHVECASLALRELGTPIDIHGGGTDLAFPHHEFERIQAETATGAPFVRFWMHVGMLRLDGEKMSKSAGNLIFVHDLVQAHDPAVIRLTVHAHHYRSSWEWRDGLIEEAAARLALWASAIDGAPMDLAPVTAALDDDLDAPAALDAVDEAARAGFSVESAAAMFGITGNSLHRAADGV